MRHVPERVTRIRFSRRLCWPSRIAAVNRVAILIEVKGSTPQSLQKSRSNLSQIPVPVPTFTPASDSSRYSLEGKENAGV